jgi:hypothetical protein
MTTAIELTHRAMALAPPPETMAGRPPVHALSALRIFNAVPEYHYGVVPVAGSGAAPLLHKGEVAVFESYEHHIHGGLIDGGLYVIEYQTPRCGMSRERFAKYFTSEYGSRLAISRKIVRTNFRREAWWVQSIEGPPSFMGSRGFVAMDGPYADPLMLTDKIIGIVVGIYRGDATIGGEA